MLKTIQPIVFIFFVSFLSFFLSACSSNLNLHGTGLSDNFMDSDQKPEQVKASNAQIKRESEAVRRFLMAELLIGQEQDKAALANLEESQRLLSKADFQIQLDLARLYLSQEEPEEAIKTLEGFDNHPELLRLKAGLLVVSQKEEQGLETYKKLLTILSGDTEALLFLAFSDYQKSDFIAAKDKLEKLLQTDSRNLPAIKLLSKVYIESGNIEGSLQQAAYYRSLDYMDEEAFKLYVVGALKLGKLQELTSELAKESRIRQSSPLLEQIKKIDFSPNSTAQNAELVAYLQQELRNKSNFFELRKDNARLFLLRQDFLSASNELMLLLIEQPNNSELRYSLALALSSYNKIKAAQKELEKIKFKDPWYTRAKTFQAVLCKQEGNLEAAKAAFEKALKKEPENDNLKTALASILAQLGDYSKSRELYQAELEKDPENQALLFAYGALLFEMKEDQQSLDIMQKIIKINPQHADALNFLAYSLADKSHELERALSLSQRSLQIEPENGFFLDTRGWIYYKMGKYSESLEDLQKALKLSNMDPEVAEHLGDVYATLNRKAEARQSYNTAIDSLVDSNLEKDLSAVIRLREKIKKLN